MITTGTKAAAPRPLVAVRWRRVGQLIRTADGTDRLVAMAVNTTVAKHTTDLHNNHLKTTVRGGT